MRSRPLRIALGVVGLALAVYGVAGLTGGWLGKPPWWERAETWVEFERRLPRGDVQQYISFAPTTPPIVRNSVPTPGSVAIEGREWISGGVVALGLALVAFFVWPRRSTPGPPSATP